MLTILHLDDDLVVVDKPAGLLSVPGPGPGGARLASVVERLAQQGLQVLPVHRLDLDVSGVLLLARHQEARDALENAFRERALEKTYWCLARGELARASGEWKDPILEELRHARISARGKPAITRWRVLRAHSAVSEVEVDLVTGRRNQIRLHFAHHGHALIGERKYARGRDDPLKARRLALHAWRLAFVHPLRGGTLRVEAPLPAELLDLCRRAQQARAPASGARPDPGPGRRPGKSQAARPDAPRGSRRASQSGETAGARHKAKRKSGPRGARAPKERPQRPAGRRDRGH